MRYWPRATRCLAARNVEQYLAFTDGRGNDVNLDDLELLCGGAFSLHHVLLLAASTFPKQLFDHFIRQLESFLFYYIFTKAPTKELERNFSIWAAELRAIGEAAPEASQRESLNSFVAEKFQKSMSSKSKELRDALNRY